MALYTPFFEKSMQNIGNAVGAQKVGKLAQSAYLGDEKALGSLMRYDPGLAQQIKTQRMQEDQVKLSTQATKQSMDQQAQQWAMQNKDMLDKVMQGAARFNTVEEARPFVAAEIERFKQAGVQIPPEFNADTLTPEQFGMIKQAYAQQEPVKGVAVDNNLVNPITGEVIYEGKGGGAGGMASAMTKIYGNGLTIQALPNGQVDVKGPDGNSLPVGSPERLQAIKEANASEIETALTKAGATAAGTQAIAMSGAMIDQIGKLKTNLLNYDNAIQAIDSGAGTGPVMSKLPSMQAASVQLDNIQKSLGLDVVGATTFGALSEAELQFALDTALPTQLEPDVLKEWIAKKRDTQAKLMDYLEGAAIYLGTPGSTPANWVKAQKELFDAQGGLPKVAADAGVTPDEWALMSKEDQALFK